MTKQQRIFIKAFGSKGTTVVIPWRRNKDGTINNDVPNFLKWLDEFERRSRKTKLVLH